MALLVSKFDERDIDDLSVAFESYSDEMGFAKHDFSKILRKTLKFHETCIYLARLDGRLISFMSYSITFSLLHGCMATVFDDCWLRKDLRGTGIDKEVIKLFMDYARQEGSLLFYGFVDDDDRVRKGYWRSFGFVDTRYRLVSLWYKS
jgi:GNAT superfamily N-acetyltransferase